MKPPRRKEQKPKKVIEKKNIFEKNKMKIVKNYIVSEKSASCLLSLACIITFFVDSSSARRHDTHRNDTQHNATPHNSTWHNNQNTTLRTTRLSISVSIESVVYLIATLCVIVLNGVILSVIMLNVVAPSAKPSFFSIYVNCYFHLFLTLTKKFLEKKD